MIYMVTATITSFWSILLQHLLRPYDPYCYSNYYVFMTYLVTAPITSFWTILLQQLLRPYDLHGYSNYHISMIHIATATITSLWFILLQPITSLWSLYPVNVRHAPIAATGGPPPDAPYQERPGGRHAKHPRICLCVIILFFSVLPFVLFDICRTEDHKPRGRASDVSTISTCVFFFCHDLLPTPPPNLCENGLGVSL